MNSNLPKRFCFIERNQHGTLLEELWSHGIQKGARISKKKKRRKPAIIEFSVRFILMLHYKFARKPRLQRECGMFIVEFQACMYSIDCVHKSREVKNTPIVVMNYS